MRENSREKIIAGAIVVLATCMVQWNVRGDTPHDMESLRSHLHEIPFALCNLDLTRAYLEL